MEPIVIWDLDDDPDGNVAHIAEHGITKEEVEDVVEGGAAGVSQTTGRPMLFGWTRTGKHIAVVYEDANDDPYMIYPVTAYETPPREARR